MWKICFSTCFLLLFFISTAECVGQRSYAVTFLKDFTSNDKKISYVIGFLCWNKGMYTNLYKTLSGQNIYTSVIIKNCTTESFNILNQQMSLIVLDISCPYAEACLTLANKLRLFRSPYKWMMLDGFDDENDGFQLAVSDPIFEGDSEKVATSLLAAETGCEDPGKSLIKCPLNFMGQLRVLIDSDVVIARRRPQFQNIILFQIYRRKEELADLVWEDYGYWNKKEGLVDKRSNRILSMRRINIKKAKLTTSVVVTNNSTLNHLDDGYEPHIDTMSKINYALTLNLMNFVNSTPTFEFVDSLVRLMPNEQIYGMIGQLFDHEAEIGGTPVIFDDFILEVLEIIALTSPTTVAFVFREPPLSTVSNIFVLPFEWTVWVAISLFLILASILMYLTTTVEEKLIKEEKSDTACIFCQKASKPSIDIGVVCLTAFGAVAQQGSVLEPRSIAGKIVNFTLFLTLMFMYVSYSANIVALLQSESNNIKTFSDLLESKLTLGADDTIYDRYYSIITDSDPVEKTKFLNEMVPTGLKPKYYPLEEGIKRVQKEPFAFYMETEIGYKFINELFTEDEKCALKEVEYYYFEYPWLAVQKNTSFAEIFKIGMRRIHQTGLQVRENLRFYAKKPLCTSKGNLVSVGLVDIRSALVLLGCGVSLAVAIFFIEILTKIKFNYLMQF